ncbi:SDR family oxidoreductase [Gallaecimonas mangrovi]|uniref:SDR family oxidoreductase n=1 Tax=Gallaecimonas mangrovi TaxID=2291597 RepID=UPI000E200797|nr:SDR family oxidoreductase [Gallaecimonas mangrovi]
MKATLKGRKVLVTGANGGIGEHFVSQALDRGAAKVYAAARRPKAWSDSRIVPLVLDITSTTDIAAAAEVAADTDVLINNAGIAPLDDVIGGPQAQLRQIFETNFFGTLAMANAFTPVLASNGGGQLLNVISLAAWFAIPTGYAASKAALWSATNALRVALAGQNTHVAGLLMGMVDTPMTANWHVPKMTADSLVTQAYDGLANGLLEIHADESTRQIKSLLSLPAEELYPLMAQQLSELQQ